MNEENKEQIEQKKNDKFPSLKKSDLSQLAKDIAMDKVFCSHFLPAEQQKSLLGMIFMPILFGATKDMSEEQINDIGFICEYYDKAGPRAINGYPMFLSCRFVSKADAKRIMIKVNKIKKALEEV